MSLTLAIVSCGPQLEVGLAGTRIKAPSIVRLAGVTPRSTLLLAAIDLLVEDSGTDKSALSKVVVTRGPGSFTGIRSGLATAAGLAAAAGTRVWAYDSLLTQAARVGGEGSVRAAQPGRRGEFYTRNYRVAGRKIPVAESGFEIMSAAEIAGAGPWVAAEALHLEGADRVAVRCSAAEALLRLAESGVDSDPIEPLYIEGPPIHRG